MPLRPAAVELLTALAAVLGRWGRWYLFGAQAVTAHGVPRLSADVDVTLEMRPEEPIRFAQEMEAAGFDPLVLDPQFFLRTRVMPFVHRATAMPLDVVLAGSGLEEEFLNRARLVDVGGTTVPVIDVEDLIIAKICRKTEGSRRCARSVAGPRTQSRCFANSRCTKATRASFESK